MTEDAASPASPPASSMASTQVRSTLIPAVRAALGLAPTVRNWKPIVLRFSSHHTPAAASRASRKPALIRRLGPAMCHSRALTAITGLIRSVRPGCCIDLVPRM